MIEKSLKSPEGPDLPAPWKEAGELPNDEPLALIRGGLLLNERAYDRMRDAPRPFRQGLVVLAYIAVLLVIGLLFGALLTFLTMPQFDIVSQRLYERIIEMGWYALLARRNPAFDAQFQQAYAAIWQVIRLVSGYPSLTGFGLALSGALLSLFGGWLGYGMTAHLFARWLGGRATLRQFYGVLALSYAPVVLGVLRAVPGFAISGVLIFLLLLITKFVAVRRAYGLSSGYSLAVVIAPYFVGIVLGVALFALVVGFGLGQIPYLDPIIRLSRMF